MSPLTKVFWLQKEAFSKKNKIVGISILKLDMANRFKRYNDKKNAKKHLETSSNLHKPPEQEPKSKKKDHPKISVISVLRGFQKFNVTKQFVKKNLWTDWKKNTL